MRKKDENQKKEEKNYYFYELEDILASKKYVETGKSDFTRYQLSEFITFTLFNSNDKFDFALLNLYNVSINCTIGVSEKTDKPYILYPSYKNKDGKYISQVNSYNKELNTLIKKILESVYC